MQRQEWRRGTLVLAAGVTLAVVLASGAQNVRERATTGPGSAAAADPQAEAKVGTLRVAVIMLNNGKSTSGRLVSQDRFGLTLAELGEGEINTKTYTTNEFEPRNVSIRTVLEPDYYLEVGDYFSSQSWDFRHDAEDFMQALRAYENARQVLETAYGMNAEPTQDLAQKIVKLRQDQDNWRREMETRAKLSQLELQATMENRLREAEQKVKQATEDVATLRKDVENLKPLPQTLATLQQSLGQDLPLMQEQLSLNTNDIAELWRTLQMQRYSGGAYYSVPFNAVPLVPYR